MAGAAARLLVETRGYLKRLFLLITLLQRGMMVARVAWFSNCQWADRGDVFSPPVDCCNLENGITCMDDLSNSLLFGQLWSLHFFVIIEEENHVRRNQVSHWRQPNSGVVSMDKSSYAPLTLCTWRTRNPRRNSEMHHVIGCIKILFNKVWKPQKTDHCPSFNRGTLSDSRFFFQAQLCRSQDLRCKSQARKSIGVQKIIESGGRGSIEERLQLCASRSPEIPVISFHRIVLLITTGCKFWWDYAILVLLVLADPDYLEISQWTG